MNNIFNNKLISKEEINLIRKKIENTVWDNKEKKLTRASFLLTEDCNLNCTYCFENKSRNKNKMTPQVAIAAIEYLIKGAKLEGEKAISITFFKSFQNSIFFVSSLSNAAGCQVGIYIISFFSNQFPLADDILYSSPNIFFRAVFPKSTIILGLTKIT